MAEVHHCMYKKDTCYTTDLHPICLSAFLPGHIQTCRSQLIAHIFLTFLFLFVTFREGYSVGYSLNIGYMSLHGISA